VAAQLEADPAHGGAQKARAGIVHVQRVDAPKSTATAEGVSTHEIATESARSPQRCLEAACASTSFQGRGNRFSGSVFGNYGNHSMTSDNFTGVQKFQLAGVHAPDSINRIYDTSAALGGPIQHDKVWFFTAHREWDSRI